MDSRVTFLQQANRGPAAARNLGIQQATGDLIAFLDADDRWLPTKLEKQVALFRAQPSLGLAYTRRLLIDADDWQLEYTQPPLYRGRVLAELFLNNFVCFSSAVIRRDVLEQIGGFDTAVEHAEDYDLLLRLTQVFDVDYVDEALVLYRTGHGNLSSQTEKRYRAVCAIMRRFLEVDGRRMLSPALVRLAWAETYSHWGTMCKDASAMAAAGRFLRALRYRPQHAEAWKGLASLCLPERVRCMLRRWSKRPPDWRQRRRLASTPS
jgi:glycosyltransferase involved in cell wall biosynthesis